MSVTVLTVDDHPQTLVVLEAALGALPLEIIGARSAEEALVVLAELDIALLITDLRMKGMSGADLARRVRLGAKNPHVPILVLSGVATDDPSLLQATALPNVHFIQKPYSVIELREIVRSLIPDL